LCTPITATSSGTVSPAKRHAASFAAASAPVATRGNTSLGKAALKSITVFIAPPTGHFAVAVPSTDLQSLFSPADRVQPPPLACDAES
jgi:hypothetical protein